MEPPLADGTSIETRENRDRIVLPAVTQFNPCLSSSHLRMRSIYNQVNTLSAMLFELLLKQANIIGREEGVDIDFFNVERGSRAKMSREFMSFVMMKGMSMDIKQVHGSPGTIKVHSP